MSFLRASPAMLLGGTGILPVFWADTGETPVPPWITRFVRQNPTVLFRLWLRFYPRVRRPASNPPRASAHGKRLLHVLVPAVPEKVVDLARRRSAGRHSGPALRRIRRRRRCCCMPPFISWASAGQGEPQKWRIAQRRQGSMSSTLRPVTLRNGSLCEHRRDIVAGTGCRRGTRAGR